MSEPGKLSLYDARIVQVFKDLCAKNGGASPAEVTHEMHSRGYLSDMDTVIDIADLMRGLRNRGLL